MTIFGEIKRKRAEQDLEHGGPAHDDQYTPVEWAEIIIHQLGKVTTGYREEGEPFFSTVDCRERFVNIAALAVAAIQSLTRKVGDTVGGAAEIMLDPIDATVGELLGFLTDTNAAFLKFVPAIRQEPLGAIFILGPGRGLEPTLAIMDALSDDEGPTETRKRVLEALDRLNAAFGLKDEEPHV